MRHTDTSRNPYFLLSFSLILSFFTEFRFLSVFLFWKKISFSKHILDQSRFLLLKMPIFFYHSFIDIVISSSYFQGDVSVFQYFSTRCFSCYRMLSCLSLQTSIKSRTNLYFMKINERWEEKDQNSRYVLTLFFQSWKPSRIGKEEKEK